MKVCLIDTGHREVQVRRVLRALCGDRFTLIASDQPQEALARVTLDPSLDIVLIGISAERLSDEVSRVADVCRLVPTLPVVAVGGSADLQVTRQLLSAGLRAHVADSDPENVAARLILAAANLSRDKAVYNSRKDGELERELEDVRAIYQSGPKLGAAVFGIRPIREVAPAEFEELVEGYIEALDQAIGRSIHKQVGPTKDSATRMAMLSDNLGFMQASARDVVDVHTTAIRRRINASVDSETSIYLEEGRLLLVELMGSLLTFYRRYAFPALRSAPKVMP